MRRTIKSIKNKCLCTSRAQKGALEATMSHSAQAQSAYVQNDALEVTESQRSGVHIEVQSIKERDINA